MVKQNFEDSYTEQQQKKNPYAIQIIFKNVTLSRGPQKKEYISCGSFVLISRTETTNYIVLKTKVMVA